MFLLLLHIEDLAEMIYERLIQKGVTLAEEDCLLMADVFFDMLIDLDLMREI